MKRNIITIGTTALLCLAFFTGQAQTDTVFMEDNEFIPEVIQVEIGTEITWVNNDAVLHTSESGTECTNDGNWDSGDIESGESFTRIFSFEGTYPYFCVYHCEIGMTGTINVVNSTDIDEQRSSGMMLKDFGPVPSHDDVRFTLELSKPSTVEISVFNLRGVKVMTETRQFEAGENNHIIDGDLLEGGSYIVRIQSENDVIVRKMIIYS